MALIKCNECGKEFSDQAFACPNCACPVENIREHIKHVEERQINQLYEESLKLYSSFKKINDLYKLKKNFESLGNYKDSVEKLNEINNRIIEYKNKNNKRKKKIIKIGIILFFVICLLFGIIYFIYNLNKKEKYDLYTAELEKLGSVLVNDNYIRDGYFHYYSNDKCLRKATGYTDEKVYNYYWYFCDKGYDYYYFDLDNMIFKYKTDLEDYANSVSETDSRYWSDEFGKSEVIYDAYNDIVTFTLHHKTRYEDYVVTFNKFYADGGINCSVKGEKYVKWRHPETGEVTRTEVDKFERHNCIYEIDEDAMKLELDRFRKYVVSYIEKSKMNVDVVYDYIVSYGEKEVENVKIYSHMYDYYGYNKEIVRYKID